MGWFEDNAPIPGTVGPSDLNMDLLTPSPTMRYFNTTPGAGSTPIPPGGAVPGTSYPGYNWIYGMNPGWVGPDGQMYDSDGQGGFRPRQSGGGSPVAYGGSPAPPTSGGATAPPASSPSGGVQTPPGGYTQDWFTQNFGRPSTPEQLVALESRLAPYGIKVLRNASGVAGDIQLPSGQVIDVIAGAMRGGEGFQWNPDIPGGTGGTGGLGSFPPYAGTFTGGGQYPLAAVMGSGLMQPWTTPFVAPNDVTQQNDPGWQFRMREGLKAIERSAASKGTLLTSGTMKDLSAWAQNTASNEYGNVYNRALGEYQMAHNIFQGNQANQFGRLYNLSSQGLTAAGGAGANNSGYMNAATGTITGQGNATGAGIAGGANAWANVPGQIVNAATDLANWYATRPTGVGYTGYAAPATPPPATTGGGFTVPNWSKYWVP